MSTDTTLCPGDSVQLFPVSTEPGTTYYSWNPPTYIDNANSATPTIKPITNINYDIIAMSMFGCKDTLSYSINVKPAAVITITDSVVLFPGETYQISPISNCTYYSWAPPVGLSDTSVSNPIANPPVSTKYIVTAKTEDGCKAIDSISIRVSEYSIISVPNAFAPSSSVNGKLKVILNGIARLRFFRIYNRWGNLVYEGEDIADGWDGTLGGVSQPQGVYVYEAEAVTDKGKILRKQGNVTLLR
jgi:gliding motility-associated-like protein